MVRYVTIRNNEGMLDARTRASHYLVLLHWCKQCSLSWIYVYSGTNRAVYQHSHPCTAPIVAIWCRLHVCTNTEITETYKTNLSQWPTWCTNFFITVITILYMYMFRAISCSSSGGQIVLIQHLVSSLSVSDRPVHRLRENCSSFSTCVPDGHLM